MLKNKLGEDSPIPKFMHLKINVEMASNLWRPLRRVSSRYPLTTALIFMARNAILNLFSPKKHYFTPKYLILLRTKFTWNINTPFSKNVKSYNVLTISLWSTKMTFPIDFISGELSARQLHCNIMQFTVPQCLTVPGIQVLLCMIQM